MARDKRSTVLVVGLGRFGSALALEMEALGHEVLAIDERESKVQRYAGQVTHAVVADATDVEVLRSLGVPSLAHAVVAIGEDIEASILCTGALTELKVPDVWSKANTESHARILKLVGSHHVIFPEAESGSRVAHLVNDRLQGYIEFEDGYAIVKMTPPKEMIGFTLAETDIRKRYGVTVVGVMPADFEDRAAFLGPRKAGYVQAIEIESIVAAVRELCGGLEGRTAIIADADGDLRRILGEALASAGCTVRGAADGEEALELMNRGPASIAVMNLTVPRVDAIGVLARMRLDEKLREVPLLVIFPQELQANDYGRLNDSVDRVVRFAPGSLRRLVDLMSEALW